MRAAEGSSCDNRSRPAFFRVTPTELEQTIEFLDKQAEEAHGGATDG